MFACVFTNPRDGTKRYVANEKCTSRNSSPSSLRLKRTIYYYFPELWNKLRDIIFQTRWLKGTLENRKNFDPSWNVWKNWENYQRDGNFYQGKFPTLRGIFEMIGRNFNSRISMLPRAARRSFLLSSEKSRILFHDLVKEMGLLLSSPRLGGSQEI